MAAEIFFENLKHHRTPFVVTYRVFSELHVINQSFKKSPLDTWMWTLLGGSWVGTR